MTKLNEFVISEGKPSILGGLQRVYQFPNGYGASVITGGYGDIDNPYELAVLKFEGKGYLITYDTPITDDVIGYLNMDALNVLLEQIKELPSERASSDTTQ